jgi:co-chaperonin GroES (HSP10)
MTPQRQWIAVKRSERVESSFLWVPVPTKVECRIGTVLAAGDGRVMKKGWTRPMPVAEGQRILYSSRIDEYHVGDEKVDVIEDESIIGVMNDDCN